MQYAHWDFPTNQLIAARFDTYAEAKELLASPKNQIIVSRGTTVRDKMYLGEEWECDHCLTPSKCLSCNPAFRSAIIAPCNRCDALTWHVDNTCLRCNPTFGICDPLDGSQYPAEPAPVHHITTMPNDWCIGHWYDGPGWYFVDEAEQLVGPFGTEERARISLAEYVEYLNTPPPHHDDG